jgi:hypothetical protein
MAFEREKFAAVGLKAPFPALSSLRPAFDPPDERVILQIVDPAQAYAPRKSNATDLPRAFSNWSRSAIGRKTSVMARRGCFPLRSARAFCRRRKIRGAR